MTPDKAGSETWPEFLVLFAYHNMYFNMRFQELEALAGLLGIDSKDVLYVDQPAPNALSPSPLALVRLPNEEAAKKLCERSVLVKAVLEVWATGPTFESAVTAALAHDQSVKDRRRAFVAPPKTFQIRVEFFGKTASMEEKKAIFDTLRPLFVGDEVANLHAPDVSLWALEEYNHQTGEKTHVGPRTSIPNRVFIARQVAGGRSIDKKLKSGEKAYFHKYDLSQRAVLGPTTLDNELAFLMANCARVQQGHLALEPFCGTGGIMVAMSHFGARVTGGEIDIRVIKGWRVAYTKNKEAALEAAQNRYGDDVQLRTRPAKTKDKAAKAKAQASPSADASNPCNSSKASTAAAAATTSSLSPGLLGLKHLVDIGVTPELAPFVAQRTPSSSSSAPPPRHDNNNNHDDDGSPDASGKTDRYEKDGRAVPGSDVFTNFYQYKLLQPDIVVCDNAARPWRSVASRGWFDCIVTDPPYGVRAASKKQGRDPAKAVDIIDIHGAYIPPKVSYGEDELASDLMSLAAEYLVDHGRLVFLQPVDLADFLGIDRAASERSGGAKGTLRDTVYPDKGRKKDPRLCISETTRDPLLLDEAKYVDYIPCHQDLKLAGASLQILSGGLGRLLVTMERLPRAAA